MTDAGADIVFAGGGIGVGEFRIEKDERVVVRRIVQGKNDVSGEKCVFVVVGRAVGGELHLPGDGFKPTLVGKRHPAEKNSNRDQKGIFEERHVYIFNTKNDEDKEIRELI